MGKKKLIIHDVNKSFVVNGQSVDVLKDINLEIEEGEFVVIVGHSGCGKSTLLKMIAGLEKNDTGILSVDWPGPQRTDWRYKWEKWLNESSTPSGWKT